MHTITFAYAYVCTDPAAEATFLLGRFTDGPHEVGFPPAAEAGSALAVRNMEGLRYTGYRIGRGPVADWGRGMFVVFSDDAELHGSRAAVRDPRTVPPSPMPAPPMCTPGMSALTVSPPAAFAPATGGPVVAAPTAASSVVAPAVPADQITEVTSWEATIWASPRTIDPATDRVWPDRM